MGSNRTLVVGLSGPSSSGKTTLARLLRSIFNIPRGSETAGHSISLFIVHEDDFYKTDEEIPKVTVTSSQHGTRTLLDWDCVESIDWHLFEPTLRHIKTHGSLPPDSFSKEDQNEVGESGASESTVQRLRDEVQSWLHNLSSSAAEKGPNSGRDLTICILDGFLLFPEPAAPHGQSERPDRGPTIPPAIPQLLDLKLFLRTRFETAVARRNRRSGYVTLEGFWADPPGYVEDVVWPNYVKAHAWMFEAGDVDDGEVRQDVVGGGGRDGIKVAPGKGDKGMTELLEWAVDVVRTEAERALLDD